MEPTDAEKATSETVQAIAEGHSATAEFCQRPLVKLYRSILSPPEVDIPNNLTLMTLAGPGMLSRKPYLLVDDEAGALLAFCYLGPRLAGHSQIVHGGMAGVLLDECMGRACFPRLEGKIAVTAKLELEYKSPIGTDSVVLIRAETTEVQGRKAWVRATIESVEDGTVFVVGKGLFVEPKWSANLPKMM
ncbi:HotDog domain-containing protein [Xylariaceae sp. FL0594]|nr:HotDog domain-containing protein [Xylariaceae sp. FL0594]